MKKAAKRPLRGSGVDLTRMAQAPTAILEGGRTRAQARFAQPAFRKFANCERRVKRGASVWLRQAATSLHQHKNLEPWRAAERPRCPRPKASKRTSEAKDSRLSCPISSRNQISATKA